LPIETYNDVIHFNASSRDLKRLKEQARLANENWIKSRWLRLSYIIRDPNDLIIVPSQRTEANFVSDQRLEASVIPLSVQSDASEELEGKIVCIENADPGFDWVFTQGIAGLITRYGGANSHVAIRCAEFGLPAAIGCGELMYNRVVNAEIVELSCFERKIRVIR
jgi:phosphohistidine swiveling domain-containing protein